MQLPYMKPQGAQAHITDAYVSSPPALVIVDETGAIWSLGFEMASPSSELAERYQISHNAPRGEFAFSVLRNGTPTGEFASRIERRNGKTRIFCRGGWKSWNGRSFT